MKRILVFLTIGLLLAAYPQAGKPISSIANKKLLGVWGRMLRGLHDLSYTEITLKEKGVYSYVGKEFGGKLKQTGTWTFKDGKLRLLAKISTNNDKPNGDAGGTFEFQLYRDPLGYLYLYNVLGHGWYQDVRWNAKKQAYFDKNGERLTME